jgi:hypothetical protein
VGAGVGDGVGDGVGAGLGDAVGTGVGLGVGLGVGFMREKAAKLRASATAKISARYTWHLNMVL